jgi:hypothetical protein
METELGHWSGLNSLRYDTVPIESISHSIIPLTQPKTGRPDPSSRFDVPKNAAHNLYFGRTILRIFCRDLDQENGARSSVPVQIGKTCLKCIPVLSEIIRGCQGARRNFYKAA